MVTTVIAATGLGLGLGFGLRSFDRQATTLAPTTSGPTTSGPTTSGPRTSASASDESALLMGRPDDIPAFEFCVGLHRVLLVRGVSPAAEKERIGGWQHALDYAAGAQADDVKQVLASIAAGDLTQSAEERDRLFAFYVAKCRSTYDPPTDSSVGR